MGVLRNDCMQETIIRFPATPKRRSGFSPNVMAFPLASEEYIVKYLGELLIGPTMGPN